MIVDFKIQQSKEEFEKNPACGSYNTKTDEIELYLSNLHATFMDFENILIDAFSFVIVHEIIHKLSGEMLANTWCCDIDHIKSLEFQARIFGLKLSNKTYFYKCEKS